MTNQASEDELGQELERLYRCVVYDLIDDVDRKELWIKEVGIVVKALIRTEKLKLLAEVRERIIGEDYDIPAEMEKAGRDFQKLGAIAKTGVLLNMFKADLRTELTKLEAEL